MGNEGNDFFRKLRSTFKIEAGEHLAAITSGLLELEKTPAAESQAPIIEVIYREAHSLKGAARAVNIMEIEAVCQSLESVFVAMKRNTVKLSPELFDALHYVIDGIGDLLSHIGEPESDIDNERASKLIQRITRLEKGIRKGGARPKGPASGTGRTSRSGSGDQRPRVQELIKTGKADSGAQPGEHASNQGHSFAADKTGPPAGTIRVSTAKLDSLLLQAEEMISVKLKAHQSVADIRDIKVMLDAWKARWAKVAPRAQKAQQLLEKQNTRKEYCEASVQFTKLLDFLDWNHNYVKSLEHKLMGLAKTGEQDRRSLGRMVDHLLEDMKDVLMLPFSSALTVLPKLVRDLSRDQNKEVELVIRGSEVEIDKRILEEMSDPFIHLLRNCIDHGIEKPEEREQNNKPERGLITVDISRVDGDKVEVIISDDGAGVDVAKLKAAAVKSGVISSDEAKLLDDREALPLIFKSEVSTSPIVTDISGRGLGLAIVREKIEKLGGRVSVETAQDIGTSFVIILPLTLATFRGILIKVSGQVFVMPVANVDRVARIAPDDVKTVENKETIEFDGRALSFAHLSDILEMPRKEAGGETQGLIHALIVNYSEQTIAFGADEVLNEQEVLIKGLGRQLSRVRNIAGATILGTGKVVPVLNVADLMRSAIKVSPAASSAILSVEAKEQRNILVVEDSITARALLKHIFEMAGYNTVTAVDGMDALTQLRSGDFNIVVSDVEMPRLDGFGLTAKMRSDKRLADIPVVLVTALESREDKERGIEVGANAYIVKSSFDQGNLLEAVRRLIV